MVAVLVLGASLGEPLFNLLAEVTRIRPLPLGLNALEPLLVLAQRLVTVRAHDQHLGQLFPVLFVKTLHQLDAVQAHPDVGQTIHDDHIERIALLDVLQAATGPLCDSNVVTALLKLLCKFELIRHEENVKFHLLFQNERVGGIPTMNNRGDWTKCKFCATFSVVKYKK
jgi:hypothetical protein